MNLEPTAPGSADPPPEPPPSWFSWLTARVGKTHAFRMWLRLFGATVTLLLVLLLYLNTVGFPSFVADRFLERMRQEGLRAELHRIRFDVLDGVTADRVVFYTEGNRARPLLEADRVALQLDLVNAVLNRPALRGLKVRNGRLRLPAGALAAPTHPANDTVLENVLARINMRTSGYDVEAVRGDLLGVRVEGRGFIVRKRDAAGSSPPGDHQQGARPLDRLAGALPDWVPDLVEQLNAVEFDSPPEAKVDFTVHLDEPERTEFSGMVLGNQTRTRGVVFDSWRLEVMYKDRTLRLPVFMATRGAQHFRLSGSLDFNSKVVEAHLQNDLPTTHWASLIPIAWRTRWEESGIVFTGPVACALHLGPAPLDDPLAKIQGEMSLARAEYRGLWIERCAAGWVQSGKVLKISDIDAVLGRDRQQGPGRGWIEFDLASRAYRGALQAGFDPSILLPIMNHKQQQIVRPMKFPEIPPRVDADFSGVLGDPRAFQWSGLLAATNFYYNGVFVNSFHAPSSVSNQVMVMDPMEILRPEGRVDGESRQDFEEKTVWFDGVSTANPKLIARALGPKAEQMMRLYRVEGPVHLEARGLVDYRTNRLTDVTVSVVATNFGVRWFVADSCAFDLRVEGPHIELTNIVGRLYEGDFSAYVDFTGIGSTTNVRYVADVAFTNVNFADVVTHLRQEDKDPYSGRFSGSATLTGLVGEGQGHTVLGQGEATIADGHLFQMPLLGGLAAMLSKINDDWAFASQTDFRSTFVIKDGKVRSDDIRLEGSLVSLRAEGEYGFNEELEYDVKVRPLREGMFAEVVQFLTSPLTVLLDFNLDGTLREPKWRPDNLPKELFGIRD